MKAVCILKMVTGPAEPEPATSSNERLALTVELQAPVVARTASWRRTQGCHRAALGIKVS